MHNIKSQYQDLKQFKIIWVTSFWLYGNISFIKACVCYFVSNFYFLPNDSPSKTMFSFHLKSSFGSLDIEIFVFWPSPLFFPVSHCFRGRSKKNLKVYVVINCLNNNWITHFIWYLEKEITCDIETLPIDREIRNIFMNKSCRKWTSKPSPRPLFNFAK